MPKPFASLEDIKFPFYVGLPVWQRFLQLVLAAAVFFGGFYFARSFPVLKIEYPTFAWIFATLLVFACISIIPVLLIIRAISHATVYTNRICFFYFFGIQKSYVLFEKIDSFQEEKASTYIYVKTELNEKPLDYIHKSLFIVPNYFSNWRKLRVVLATLKIPKLE